MPLKVNEFVIQAKFDSPEEVDAQDVRMITSQDLELLREDIIRDCMDKVEEYLRRKESR